MFYYFLNQDVIFMFEFSTLNQKHLSNDRVVIQTTVLKNWSETLTVIELNTERLEV